MNEPTQKYIITKYATSGKATIEELYKVDGGNYLSGISNRSQFFASAKSGVCCKTRTEAIASVEKLFYKRRRSLEKALNNLDDVRKEVVEMIKRMTEMPE